MTRRDHLVEALAAAEHASWAHWQAYLFSCCERLPDGSLVIPAEKADRWQRQIETPYADLSEREKQSDRDEVAKILPLIDTYAAYWEEEFHVARELLVKQEQYAREQQDACQEQIERLLARQSEMRALLKTAEKKLSYAARDWPDFPIYAFHPDGEGFQEWIEATRALLASPEPTEGQSNG